MEKNLCDAMCEKGEMIATVISHPELKSKNNGNNKRRRVKITCDEFIGQDVIVDAESAKIFKTSSGDKIRVKIRLKNKPNVIQTIFTDFLLPLTENCKNFFKIENHI